MSKSIIVAGAGHGGLVTAAKLAKKGFDVTVFEKGKKGTLGHDWEDRFNFDNLSNVLEVKELPVDIWRYRGDCAFVSPSHHTTVKIKYTEETRQKVMWRKPLIDLLTDFAEKCGAVIRYECEILAPIVDGDKVVGVKTADGDVYGDLIVDALGVNSVIRCSLPDSFNIEKQLKRGDAFYAYRAYYDKTPHDELECPFEVYLYHECEQGLSWFCTNEDNVDVLIGRIDKLTDEKVREQLAIFKHNHTWLGDKVLHGGQYGVIPVRRPLPIMVANGYAAIGDSAFMTTPMNGMGIDLSLLAGGMLAEVVVSADGDYSVNKLWEYNRRFHVEYGGDTSKNEGLKNALLKLPAVGVDFLFDNAVIQSADLAGAGRNMNLGALLGKFVRGMKNPKYFFAIIKGLMKGAKACKLYKKAPAQYEATAVAKWQKSIEECTIDINE